MSDTNLERKKRTPLYSGTIYTLTDEPLYKIKLWSVLPKKKKESEVGEQK